MNKKISASVGKKIRSLRESHGMSGKELSLLLGISQQHQSRYENGEVNIHVDTIYQISQIFRVEPSYFFTDFYLSAKVDDEVNFIKNFFQAESVVI